MAVRHIAARLRDSSPICRSCSKKAGLSSIEQSTYSYCSDLTSINIPDNVTSIDYGAFKDCSNLTSIKIPDNIIMIGIGDGENCGYSAFYGIPQIIYDGSNCTNYSEWGADEVIRSDGTILYSRDEGNDDDE